MPDYLTATQAAERLGIFDPNHDIPRTDEEVLICLERGDDLLTRALRGLYQCLRAQGKPLLVAYEKTLRAHIAAWEAKRE